MPPRQSIQDDYSTLAPDYFRAGWQPLPLPPRAKTPPPSGYTGEGGKLVGSIVTIREWGAARPGANLGLRLLHPFIGIDVDTHDGRDGAATLAAAQEALGPLPPTIVSSARPDPLVSGIRIYRLPSGAAPITAGAEKRLREAFGTGIDIIRRGHRYVVAAPSIHPDLGTTYRWTGCEGVPSLADVADLPPAWTAYLVGDDEPAEETEADADPFEADGSVRYFDDDQAADEISSWVERLRLAPRGAINTTLADTASHLMHFVPAFLTRRDATRLLLEAQRDAWVAGGGADDKDYSAARATIDRTIDVYVPATRRIGAWWEARSDTAFDHVDLDDGDDGGVEAGKGDAERSAPGSTSSGSGSTGTDSAADGFGDFPDDEDDGDSLARLRAERTRKRDALRAAQLLAAEVERETARRAAKALLDERELSRPVDAGRLAGLRADMLTSAELDGEPELEPLIDGWIWKGTLSQIYGASGAGKSFIAADMARAVSSGEPWHGHETGKGPVLYVCAEGVRGFAKRIRAMEAVRGTGPLDLTVVRRAVQIGGPEWPELIDVVRTDGYVMVIVDTQARSSVGRNENASDDMGQVVRALDMLIEATGAGVLLVHHSGKGAAADGRGSSAVKGALQTQIRVERKGGMTVTVTATKQKDHDELGPYSFELVPQGDSLVVSIHSIGAGRDAERARSDAELVKSLDITDLVAMAARPAIARVLAGVFGGGQGATKAEIYSTWVALARSVGKEAPGRTTFNSAWTHLTKSGAPLRHPKFERYVLGPKGAAEFGLAFERPAWVSEAEWEESISSGRLDPAILLPCDGGTARGTRIESLESAPADGDGFDWEEDD